MQQIPALHTLKNNYLGNNIDATDFEDYKKFLYLISLYPRKHFVPTNSIDKIWHLHLENESLYKADCISNYGFLIKHTFHNRLSLNLDAHKKNFEETKKLWNQTFNEDLNTISSFAFCGFDGDGVDVGGSGSNGNDD